MAKDILTDVLDLAESSVKHIESEVGDLTEPIRLSALKRFPILFTLLVTFGVTSIIFGFERLLSEIALLHTHPFLMVLLGVSVLLCTGKLYKKL